MRDDQNPQPIDLALLERTARVVATRRRVEDGYRRVMEMWRGAGFTEGQVMRALDALSVDIPAEYDELRGAQKILETLKAPVQLELIKMAETRITSDQGVLDLAHDAGFYARFQGLERRPIIEGRRLSDEAERAAWFAGYDEAAALLRCDAEDQ